MLLHREGFMVPSTLITYSHQPKFNESYYNSKHWGKKYWQTNTWEIQPKLKLHIKITPLRSLPHKHYCVLPLKAAIQIIHNKAACWLAYVLPLKVIMKITHNKTTRPAYVLPLKVIMKITHNKTTRPVYVLPLKAIIKISHNKTTRGLLHRPVLLPSWPQSQ